MIKMYMNNDSWIESISNASDIVIWNVKNNRRIVQYKSVVNIFSRTA